MPRFWLYVDLVFIGAGLGLTMLTLLIAVQQSVERRKLGVATSLSQFSRAIGGAFGVAIMGAFLTAGLAAQLNTIAQTEGAKITIEQASEFAANPNALIDPQEKAKLPPETLDVLQQAMAVSIHKVFWVGAVLSALALCVAFFLPAEIDESMREGEKIIMAENVQ